MRTVVLPAFVSLIPNQYTGVIRKQFFGGSIARIDIIIEHEIWQPILRAIFDTADIHGAYSSWVTAKFRYAMKV